MFTYVILGLLRDRVPRHGYALMREYRARSGLALGAGSFYRELQRLVAVDAVRPVDRPAGVDPRRLPYEITERGVELFDGWLSQAKATVEAGHGELLTTQTLFLADTPPDVATRLFAAWEEELSLQQHLVGRDREDPGSGQSAEAPQWHIRRLLVDRRIRHIAADIEFVAECRAVYAEWGTIRGKAVSKGAAQRSRAGEGSGNQRRLVRGALVKTHRPDRGTRSRKANGGSLT